MSISAMPALVGKLVPMDELKGVISVDAQLTGSLSNDWSYYSGEYEITPLTNSSQILKTKDKMMRNNVVVEEIPYYETSNISGGETVYIGKDVVINGS